MKTSARSALIALTLVSGALVAADIRAQALAFRDAGGVRYVCGGVGSEERRELQALRQRGQLEILFASAPRGAYVSGVVVQVAAMGREGAVVRFRAEGPTCLVDAAPGTWRVTARLGDVERSREVKLPSAGAKVVITFPDEPWDGIRASDEEKRQAREP